MANTLLPFALSGRQGLGGKGVRERLLRAHRPTWKLTGSLASLVTYSNDIG